MAEEGGVGGAGGVEEKGEGVGGGERKGGRGGEEVGGCGGAVGAGELGEEVVGGWWWGGGGGGVRLVVGRHFLFFGEASNCSRKLLGAVERCG